MSELMHDPDGERFAVVGGTELAMEPRLVGGSGDAHFEDHDRMIEASTRPTPSPSKRAAKRFAHNKLAVVGLLYLGFVIALAVFGSWIMPHDPNAQDFQPMLGPSAEHWLGTDDLGRDSASRLIAGASVSMRAAFQTVTMAVLIAVPLGLAAGYFRGRADGVLLRGMDALNSIPALVLALVVAAVLGPGLGNAIIAITIVLIPGFVRLTRGSTLAVAQETYVDASRSIGTPTHAILRKRVLPSVLSPLIVWTTLILGAALVAEASLSFLGLGTQPPDASWGNMLSRSYGYIYSEPFLMVPPGMAILLAVLAFNVVGDALRDALGLGEAHSSRTRKRGRLGLTVGPTASRRAESRATETTVVDPADASERAVLTPTTDRQPVVDEATLLSVRGLRVEFDTDGGPLTVVDGVSFDVGRGEVVGLVGESGSGKTVTSLSIMRLLPTPPARIVGGSVHFGGRDLLALSFDELAAIRGSAISMVFQDPMASLNPAFTIGNQLVEAVRWHRDVSKADARRRAKELLDLVGIPDAEARLHEYPHRLSGGMRQRVLIAMALANEPQLLIADEPTTALDVTVQAQILDLLRTLQRELGMAMVFVTHDLGVIADIADRVIVMYAGELVEQAPVHDLFSTPQHPYTRRLLAAMPQVAAKGERLASIPGVVPVPGHWAAGCRFAPRCDLAADVCRDEPVPITVLAGGREVRCACHGDVALQPTISASAKP